MWQLLDNQPTPPTSSSYTQVTTSWTYITRCLPGSFGSFDGNCIGSQVISLLAQIFQVCFVHILKEKCHLNVTQSSLRKDLSYNQQLSPHAHLTDIVGINFSLNELGQVCWQAVFVNNFFSFGFVDNLKYKKKKKMHNQTTKVVKRVSWHRKRISEQITLHRGAFYEKTLCAVPIFTCKYL